MNLLEVKIKELEINGENENVITCYWCINELKEFTGF
jgi:hypothetical protein